MRAHRIPYSGRYFVDRDGQLDLVLDKVRALLRGESVRRRTTAFYGPRGSGKSWLICELQSRLLGENEFKDRVSVLCLVCGERYEGEDLEDCFSMPSDETESWPSLVVGQALEWALKRLKADLSSVSPSIDIVAASLVEHLRRQAVPVVVLVDGINQVPAEFLRCLESYFLAPLIREAYVLVVLGGRTRDPRPAGGYTWQMPELKLYSDEFELEPFDELRTREQLARLKDDYHLTPAAAPQIMEVGGGYPLSNVVLGRYLAGDPPTWQDKQAALKKCAEVMLENVDPRLHGYFWALCVLRAFDEDRMPPLLAVWFEGDETTWSYQRCRQIREDMVATRLARWRGRQGFVMDEAVREVLENALRETDRDCWGALHAAARELYATWVKRYPSAEERWQSEVDHHCAHLEESCA